MRSHNHEFYSKITKNHEKMQKKCDFDRKMLDMDSKIPYNPIINYEI